jgi:hypothetical protein
MFSPAPHVELPASPSLPQPLDAASYRPPASLPLAALVVFARRCSAGTIRPTTARGSTNGRPVELKPWCATLSSPTTPRNEGRSRARSIEDDEGVSKIGTKPGRLTQVWTNSLPHASITTAVAPSGGMLASWNLTLSIRSL